MSFKAGWNVPGYLPETEPEEFDTFEAAVRYLAGAVDRFWDEDYDAVFELADGDEMRSRADERWLPIHTVLYSTPGPTQTHFQHEAGGYVFWIEPAE